MNNNDERIIKLKAQIATKRTELNTMPSRVVPITNCLLSLDDRNYNLHVEASEFLLIKLNMYVMSARDLDIDLDNIIISGYKITDWISDIKDFLAVKKYKAEKKKLDLLEKKLDNLLSEDKRTELEIDNIIGELDL